MNILLRRGLKKKTFVSVIIFLQLFLVSSMVLPGMAFGAAGPGWGEGVLVAKNAGMPWEMTQLISDGDGNVFVVWTDGKSSEQKLFAQKLDPNGNLLWNEPVNVNDQKNLYYGHSPVVKSDGGLIIAWSDNRNKRKPDVFAQKIDGNGNKLWGDKGVTVYDGCGAQDIRMAVPDNASGAIIVWRDDERPGLYMQRIGPDGNRLWQAGGISVNELCGIEVRDDEPYLGYDMPGEWVNIAPDGQGGLYVSWTDFASSYIGIPEKPGPSQGEQDGHIFLQRVGSNGHKVWPSNISIEVKGTSFDPWMSQLLVAEDNSVFVTWSQPVGGLFIEGRENGHSFGYYPNPNTNLFATKITPDGEIIWNHSRPLLTSGGAKEYYEQTMPIAFKDGLLYMKHKMKFETREEKYIGPGGEVELSRGETMVPMGNELIKIDGNGKVAWKKTIPSSSGFQYPIADKTGGFFLVSNKYSEEGPYPFESISVQRFNSDGKAMWKENGIAITDGAGMPYGGIAPDGRGGLYISWRAVKPNQEDPSKHGYGPYEPGDEPQSDIYVQHIIDDGSGWSDIGVSDWSFSYIDVLVKMGAINGYGDGSFKPEGYVTRAEFAKMVVLALDIQDNSSSGASAVKAKDIDGHWAAQYIEKTGVAGTIKGYPDGTFRPDAKITRAEAATIIYRTKGLRAMASSQEFSDVPVGHWAFQSIDGARKLGVVAGYGDGTFRPSGNATRAEAAKMIYMVININN